MYNILDNLCSTYNRCIRYSKYKVAVPSLPCFRYKGEAAIPSLSSLDTWRGGHPITVFLYIDWRGRHPITILFFRIERWPSHHYSPLHTMEWWVSHHYPPFDNMERWPSHHHFPLQEQRVGHPIAILL